MRGLNSDYKEGSDNTFAGDEGGEASAVENGQASIPPAPASSPPPPPAAAGSDAAVAGGAEGAEEKVGCCGCYASIKSKHEQFEEWRNKGEWVSEQEETDHKVTLLVSFREPSECTGSPRNPHRDMR